MGWTKTTATLATLALLIGGCFVDQGTDVNPEGGTESEGSTSTSSSSATGPSSGTTTGGSTTAGATSNTQGDPSDTDVGTSSAGSDGGTTDGPPSELCPFIDDFEDGVLDDQWVPNIAEAFSEEDGMALVRVTGPTFGMDGEFPLMTIDPPGGMVSATVRLQIGTYQPTEGLQLLLWLRDNGGNTVAFLVNGYPPALTRLEVQVNDVEDPDSFAIISPGDYTWLQVREMGGTLFFDASADGSIFENLYSIKTPSEFDVSNVSVGFAGNNWVEFTSDTAVGVDAFEFECGPQ